MFHTEGIDVSLLNLISTDLRQIHPLTQFARQSRFARPRSTSYDYAFWFLAHLDYTMFVFSTSISLYKNFNLNTDKPTSGKAVNTVHSTDKGKRTYGPTILTHNENRRCCGDTRDR